MNNNTQLENSWNTATLKSNKITKPEANSFLYNVVRPDRNVNIDSDVFHYVFQWKRHFLGGQIDKIGNTIFPNGREKYSTGRESDRTGGKKCPIGNQSSRARNNFDFFVGSGQSVRIRFKITSK